MKMQSCGHIVTFFVRWTVAVCCPIVLVAASVMADDSSASKADDKVADETAIRASGDAFTKAVGRGDAKAVAALWTENGTLADDRGAALVHFDSNSSEQFLMVRLKQPSQSTQTRQ